MIHIDIQTKLDNTEKRARAIVEDDARFFRTLLGSGTEAESATSQQEQGGDDEVDDVLTALPLDDNHSLEPARKGLRDPGDLLNKIAADYHMNIAPLYRHFMENPNKVIEQPNTHNDLLRMLRITRQELDRVDTQGNAGAERQRSFLRDILRTASQVVPSLSSEGNRQSTHQEITTHHRHIGHGKYYVRYYLISADFFRGGRSPWDSASRPQECR
jgi:hypothetical protein